MHAQGLNSQTFTAAPLDGSLTLPQLLDRQLAQSPRHTAYIYDGPDGEIISISFDQYIRTVYVACRRILDDTVPHIPVVPDGQATVVGIFAATDSISYCMMVAAIMRAGLIPFCISPRNAASGVANLLEKTGAAVVYVSTDLKSILAEALEISGKPLPVFDVLIFTHLQAAFEKESPDSASLPALPTVMDIDSTGIILHSSGSTSIFSKPVYLPHRLILQYASVPWSGSKDYCGEILGAHSMPNFHGMGVFLSSWPFSTGLIMAVLRPTTPPMPSTPKTTLAGLLATKPDFVMATPASIESWSEDPVGMKAMQALKALSYLGATLNKRVGDTLVVNGISLCCAYGTMETGLLTPFFMSYGVDWEYLAVRKEYNTVRVPEDDGSGLYTHTYLVSPSYATAYTNVEIDGRLGCSISDLLEQHSDNPDLHRVYGRKDDLIRFSTAAKMNPVPIEAQINRNPFVDGALVFGNARPYPGVLIQLKPEFQADLADEEKRSKLSDALWASVDGANKTSPTHFQIPRKMVLLADPRKPFALTSKAQPRRRVVFENYKEEICAAYL
ncbi:Acetyl-CoA synthetase-like protein [Mycena venus]|uniref:Acetyl-CoA synthetase-like protein n=1 Tax=Mycena venus TaxID=2733690 RepID=A0A8H6Y993_9AGAR|nr:Acetyl-CoA synthetase-like protein [Mycena venus]